MPLNYNMLEITSSTTKSVNYTKDVKKVDSTLTAKNSTNTTTMLPTTPILTPFTIILTVTEDLDNLN